MNKVTLIGRTTKEVELRTTTTGKSVATFTLAVNRFGREETDFLNIIVWGKQAENCQKYLHKGNRVALEGKIQTRSYDDQNGKKRYVTEIVAEYVEFIENKKEVSEETNENVFESFGNSIKTESSIGEQIQIEDSDLPF